MQVIRGWPKPGHTPGAPLHLSPIDYSTYAANRGLVSAIDLAAFPAGRNTGLSVDSTQRSGPFRASVAKP